MLTGGMDEIPGEGTTTTPMGTTLSEFQSDVSESAFGVDGANGTNGGGGDTGTSGRAFTQHQRAGGAVNRSQKRKRQSTATMKGRFCGRLPTKEDEKKLVQECSMIATFLHPDARLNTVATIVRGIATGEVRAHLAQAREHEALGEALQQANARLEVLKQAEAGAGGGDGSEAHALAGLVVSLKDELKAVQDENSRLRKDIADRELAGATGMDGPQQFGLGPPQQGDLLMERSLSMPVQAAGIHGVAGVAGMSGPSGTIGINGMEGSAGVIVPNGVQQALGLMHRSASAAQLTGMGVDEVGVEVQHHMMEASGSMELASRVNPEATLIPDVMAGAQQFVRAATLHLVAKEEAAFNAHALTAEARKHSVASIKASEQAEDLKKTLSSMTELELDSEKAMEAQKTVKSLEVRAQIHASMTTQAVAKAKSMMEIAQNHEREQAIAIETAKALQGQTIGGVKSPELGTTAGVLGTIDPSSLAPVLSVVPSIVPSAPNSTVAKPDITSMVAAANNNDLAGDLLPNTALNLQNAIPPRSVPLPLLDQSISYLRNLDPSTDATALHQQISAMHAQQPESLVSAPPVHIEDLENISFAGMPLPDVSKLVDDQLDAILEEVHGGDDV